MHYHCPHFTDYSWRGLRNSPKAPQLMGRLETLPLTTLQDCLAKLRELSNARPSFPQWLTDETHIFLLV